MAIPDGGPLSTVGQKRGHKNMERTTGPSLMGEIFEISAKKGYRHYFYGSKEETLELLYQKLTSNYPGIQIAGMYSPPFRPLTEEEDRAIVERINETKEQVSKVSMFKEKPTQEVAKDYIAKGALWNGGVFAFKLGYVLNRAHELIDFVDYEDLFNKYDTLNKISFDYAVVEHEPEIEVMRFAGTWKDLGTWNTLTEAMDSHAVGEALFNEKCENVHVVNELDVPILCIAFRVLLCVNGCGTISYEGGNLPFYKGDCIFVPADSEVLTIHGQAQFLDVRG